jgi:hypothetical protein
MWSPLLVGETSLLIMKEDINWSCTYQGSCKFKCFQIFFQIICCTCFMVHMLYLKDNKIHMKRRFIGCWDGCFIKNAWYGITSHFSCLGVTIFPIVCIIVEFWLLIWLCIKWKSIFAMNMGFFGVTLFPHTRNCF